MYCANPGSGLNILDISDPTLPQVIGFAPLDNTMWDVEVNGDYAYLSQSHGVNAFNISDPYNPVEVGYYEYDNLHVRGMHINGDLLYLVSQTAELMVLDVSDSTNPTFLGQSGNYADNSTLFEVNDHIITANSSGLFTYDVFSPATPLYLSNEPASAAMDAIKVGDYFYLAGRNYISIFSVDVASTVYGDVDQSGEVNVGDVVYIVNFIFRGGVAPIPLRSADANCDGFANIGDAVNLISYIFRGGPAPGCGE
ncbi:MAG: hypothetical protein KAR42_02935 [candidate division Zixibacteria bacterium]|nr:hypothetical protein [candidate division Zixibacteria bacterium]